MSYKRQPGIPEAIDRELHSLSLNLHFLGQRMGELALRADAIEERKQTFGTTLLSVLEFLDAVDQQTSLEAGGTPNIQDFLQANRDALRAWLAGVEPTAEIS